jgi:hypothetical protein
MLDWFSENRVHRALFMNIQHEFSALLFTLLLFESLDDVVNYLWWCVGLPKLWIVISLRYHVVQAAEPSNYLVFSWVADFKVRTYLVQVIR